MIDAFLARPKVVAGQFLRAAVAWWFAELAAMVPAAFARLWGAPGQVAATLDLTGDRVFLVLQERGRATPLSVALAMRLPRRAAASALCCAGANHLNP